MTSHAKALSAFRTVKRQSLPELRTIVPAGEALTETIFSKIRPRPSIQVVHMEVALQGLAAIVVNAYRGSAESRGARGTAGSGSGTRTLVDGLSLSMAHNHWLAVNHLDLHASLPLQNPDDGVEGQGGGPGGEEGKGGGLSRGFEAPPLDAAKVINEGESSTALAERRVRSSRFPPPRARLVSVSKRFRPLISELAVP